MKHQTHIAAVMLVSSSLLCAFVLRDVAYPAILCVLGLLGLRRKIILAIQPERRVLSLLILLFLLILFGIHYRFFTLPSQSSYGPQSSMAWHTVTRYFLASMVVMLFLGMPDQLPLSFGFFFVAAMMSAGQTFLMNDRIGVYRSLEIVCVVLLLFYASLSPGSPLAHLLNRRKLQFYGPKLFVVVALLITVNAGWMLGSLLYQHQGMVSLLGNLWKNQASLLTARGPTTQIGFSRDGRLGTINDLLQSEDLEITLRISSSLAPGYLRAQTFDYYLKGRWDSRSVGDVIQSNDTRLDLLSLGNRVRVYKLRNPGNARLDSMIVRHVASLGDAMFLPLNVAELTVRDRYLNIDDDLVVSRSQGTQTPYAVKYSQTPATDRLGRIHRARSLRVQDNVRQELGGLAASLYEDCVTTDDKIRATIDYFKDNYTYSLIMPKPPGRDPLVSFVKQGQVGYCEYFASGAALLLRLGNVPTRYVTGFYVTEKETLTSNTWVARNNDAHAWVEAWDEERGGWRVVEATVQDALDDALANAARNENGLQSLAIVQRLMQALYRFGILGILVWLYTEGGLVFQFGLCLALVVAVVLMVRKFGKRTPDSGSRHPAAHSAQWRALHKMRDRLERCLRRKGLHRQPHETVLVFAQNITHPDLAPQTVTSLRQWYAQYSNLRYQRDTTTGEVEELTQTLGRLLREFRKKQKRNYSK